MTTPTNDRREVLAAVVNTALHTGVCGPVGDVCCWGDPEEEAMDCATNTLTRLAAHVAAALDAALAAQEGERGGAEVAAAVEAVCVEIQRVSDAMCPSGTYDAKDKVWRVAGSRRYVVSEVRAALADPAGALAKHDAEVLRAAADHASGSFPLNGELRHDGTADPQAAAYVEGLRDARSILLAEADRIEAQP